MRSSRLTIALTALLAGTATGWFFAPVPSAGPNQSKVSKSSPESSTPTPPVANPAPTAPAENEFVARLHEILSIGKREKRERAVRSIADGMSIPEIRDALQRLEGIRVRERDRIRNLLLAQWGILDPKGAMVFAMDRGNLAERIDAVNAVLGGWVEKDASSAEAWVAALPTGPLRGEAMGILVKGLAISDPKHALQLAQDSKNIVFRSYFVSTDGGSPLVHALFDKWLDDDPKAAAEAAIALPDSVHFRKTALHVIGKRWASKDIDAALAWAESNTPVLDNADHQSNPLTGVVDGWLTTDPAAAIAWLNDLPDGDGKVGLIRAMVSCVDDRDPAQAMDLAIVIPPGSMREQAIIYSARSWLQSDPGSAAKWAFQQEDESIRRTSLRSVAAEWMRNDPAGARGWIDSLPADVARDTMLGDAIGMIANGVSWGGSSYMGFVETMSSEAIQNAAQTIEQISDVTQRKTAYTTLAGKWLSRDPQAAQAWIGSLPVTNEEKEALLKAKAPPWPPKRK